MASSESINKEIAETGHTTVSNVLDGQTVQEARAHIDFLMENNPDVSPEQLGYELYEDGGPSYDPFWAHLVSDERLVELAAEVLDEEVVHFDSGWFLKSPHSNIATRWHQDGGYWDGIIDPREEVVTVWVAFDEVTQENGCMRVVPKSHTGGFFEHAPTTNEDQDILEKSDENSISSDIVGREINSSNAVDVELSPGDVSLHHPALLHSAYGNTSDRRRRALIIRYTSTATTFDESEPDWPQTFLLRGEPSLHQRYHKFPQYNSTNESHRRFPSLYEYKEKRSTLNGKLE